MTNPPLALMIQNVNPVRRSGGGRRFARASALVAVAVSLAGCSAILDWSGYTGGDASATDVRSTDAATDVGSDGSFPACTWQMCGGCCDSNGYCAGGQSVGTCGAGGEPCQNCASRGLACVGNACTAAPLDDGGTPKCTASSCVVGRCIPFWQGICCKDDGTCGCQTVLPKGQCL